MHLVPAGSPKTDYTRQDERLEPENTPPGKTSSKTIMFKVRAVNLRGCNHPYLLGPEKGSVLACSHMFYMNLNAKVLNYQWRFVSHFTIHESGTAALKHAHTHTKHTLPNKKDMTKNKALLVLSIPYGIP